MCYLPVGPARGKGAWLQVPAIRTSSTREQVIDELLPPNLEYYHFQVLKDPIYSGLQFFFLQHIYYQRLQSYYCT